MFEIEREISEIENELIGDHLSFSIDFEMAGVIGNPPFSTSIYEVDFCSIAEIIDLKCAHLPEVYFTIFGL